MLLKKIDILKNNIKKGLFPAKSSRKVENKSILEAKVDLERKSRKKSILKIEI
jgi:hypothetical protein